MSVRFYSYDRIRYGSSAVTDDEQELRRSNGWRSPLVGGTSERHVGGASFKQRKRLENALTPASRVHTVCARLMPGLAFLRLR